MLPTQVPRTALRRFACLTAALAALAALPARAQVVKPWVPQGDSLSQIVTTARMQFKYQQGDSVTGDNYSAFERVSTAGRHLLRALGRDHLLQAAAIATTLDSMGLDVDIAQDPQTPTVVLMLVRNPNRPSSQAVGFLYWYRQDELLVQGASFPPARGPRLRVWWTGEREGPYEAAVIYQPKTETPPGAGFKLFRMNSEGYYWDMIQYEGHGPELGPRAEAAFADVNHDGKPELLVFHDVDPDSYFVARTGVSPITNEFLYAERPEGFVLHDARTVPGPLQALRAFAELLQDRQVERARRLLATPGDVQKAVANGWVGLRGNNSWLVEYGEKQAWPSWYEVKVRTARASKRWIFHFSTRNGMWIVHDWIPVQEPGTTQAPPPAKPRVPARARGTIGGTGMH